MTIDGDRAAWKERNPGISISDGEIDALVSVEAECGFPIPINSQSEVQQHLLYLRKLGHAYYEARDGHVAALGINNKELKQFPPSISRLHFLEDLNLDGNQLITLPDSIGEMQSLKSLNVNDNRIVTIPDTIGMLESLKILSVENNPLTNLPNSIENLKKLEELHLKNNFLTTIPNSTARTRVEHVGRIPEIDQVRFVAWDAHRMEISIRRPWSPYVLPIITLPFSVILFLLGNWMGGGYFITGIIGGAFFLFLSVCVSVPNPLLIIDEKERTLSITHLYFGHFRSKGHAIPFSDIQDVKEDAISVRIAQGHTGVDYYVSVVLKNGEKKLIQYSPVLGSKGREKLLNYLRKSVFNPQPFQP